MNFESERLLYREICVDDAENIVRWRGNPDTYVYFRNPKQVSIKEHLKWYENNYLKNFDRTDFIIIERESAAQIGVVGISIVNGVGEVSYIIGEKNFLRRGFGTEAICAIVKSFSDKVIGFGAEIHPQNIASIKVIEKCGFKFERQLDSGFLFYRCEGFR